MSDEVEWVPAFKGQRPPFQPGNQWRFGEGNTAHSSHGARSARAIAPIASRISQELRAECDWLNTPRFAAALDAYTTCLARIELLQAWIDTLTPERAADPTKLRSPLEQLRILVRQSITLADRLGLNPSTAWEVEDAIAASQLTLARRAERKRLAADLKASLRAEQDER